MIAIADKSLAREILVKRIVLIEKEVLARRRPSLKRRLKLQDDIAILIPDCRSTGFIETRLDALLIWARNIGMKVPDPKADSEYYRARWAREEADWERFRESAGGTKKSKADTTAEKKALAKELGVDLSLPDFEMKRLIRLLSFDAHPDRGGSHERMCKVNRLRELVAAV